MNGALCGIRTHADDVYETSALAAGRTAHRPLVIFASHSALEFPALRPLIMDLSALLSVVSQLLSVCVPSGFRKGATLHMLGCAPWSLAEESNSDQRITVPSLCHLS